MLRIVHSELSSFVRTVERVGMAALGYGGVLGLKFAVVAIVL
jgi:hypothetical protein